LLVASLKLDDEDWTVKAGVLAGPVDELAEHVLRFGAPTIAEAVTLAALVVTFSVDVANEYLEMRFRAILSVATVEVVEGPQAPLAITSNSLPSLAIVTAGVV
jgi:hypothetical protein